jgi:hypothetical protein
MPRRQRWAVLGLEGATVWLTGLPGAGKSTIGEELERRLIASGRPTYLLDGENMRHGLSSDLGFSAADRHEHARRVASVARILADAGNVAIVAMNAKRNYERPTEVQIFARLANFGPEPVSSSVELTVDGQPVQTGSSNAVYLLPERWNEQQRQDYARKPGNRQESPSVEFQLDLTESAVVRVEQTRKNHHAQQLGRQPARLRKSHPLGARRSGFRQRSHPATLTQRPTRRIPNLGDGLGRA